MNQLKVENPEMQEAVLEENVCTFGDQLDQVYNYCHPT